MHEIRAVEVYLTGNRKLLLTNINTLDALLISQPFKTLLVKLKFRKISV